MKTVGKLERLGPLVGASAAMQQVYDLIHKAARVDMPVLIIGETGTGKELVAQQIHRESQRADSPFVAVNMGAMSPELMHSELFGHVKGAYTGALDDKMGHYEAADHGTLFLDEIGTTSDRLQVALLRVLEEGTFRRLGARQDLSANVRLIAATNEDLDGAVQCGAFREDLFYRLQVLCINMPPLRDHVEDVPQLAAIFCEQVNAEFGFEISGITREAMGALMAYHWPGNTRELKNVMAQSCVMAEEGEIGLQHLPGRIAKQAAGVPAAAGIALGFGAAADAEAAAREAHPGEGNGGGKRPEEGLYIPLGATLEEVQKTYTLKTLAGCANNKTKAAEMLGVSRKTLYDKLSRWGLRKSG